MYHLDLGKDSLSHKIRRLNLPYLLILVLIASIGTVLLYGAAGGSWQPYAARHITRFILGLGLVSVLALMDLKWLYRSSYWIYLAALVLLALVPVMGVKVMGATRWLDLGLIRVQPSEMIKIGLILALARYYHARQLGSVNTFTSIIFVLLMIAVPAALTVVQPDLGTALLLVMMGAGIMFAAGVSWKFFALCISSFVVMLPLGWHMLHDYQRGRVLTFLDPSRDPLGAGYHIIQSKIAIGSAGFWGKGFMEGSQSQLLFLPEKHTDFIFPLLIEDFGMMGALVLMGLYLTLILMSMGIAMRSLSQFAAILAVGVTLYLFLYTFINMAMVMGLLPVVGVPLPLVSYGGTSMLTLLVGVGLVLNADINRFNNLPGAGGLSSGRF